MVYGDGALKKGAIYHSFEHFITNKNECFVEKYFNQNMWHIYDINCKPVYVGNKLRVEF